MNNELTNLSEILTVRSFLLGFGMNMTYLSRCRQIRYFKVISSALYAPLDRCNPCHVLWSSQQLLLFHCRSPQKHKTIIECLMMNNPPCRAANYRPRTVKTVKKGVEWIAITNTTGAAIPAIPGSGAPASAIGCTPAATAAIIYGKKSWSLSL